MTRRAPWEGRDEVQHLRDTLTRMRERTVPATYRAFLHRLYSALEVDQAHAGELARPEFDRMLEVVGDEIGRAEELAS